MNHRTYLERRAICIDTSKNFFSDLIFYCSKCDKYLEREQMVSKKEIALNVLRAFDNSFRLSDIVKIKLREI